MSMLVACVLRSGGDFRPSDVDALRRQVSRHLPNSHFFALTDAPIDCALHPMIHQWPGFWSKMELFHPSLAPAHDLLYLDLDTVVVGDLSWTKDLTRFTMARDFYYPTKLSSAMMFLPYAIRPRIWERWMVDSAGWMKRYHSFREGIWGDGAFLDECFGEEADRFQAIAPGKVLSYKADCLGAKAPPWTSSVVCFHGHPRPWHVTDPWVVKARAA